jgi:predicted nucleic acid-binding protein
LEPVRTLDAIHLATAAIFHESLGGLQVLSFDERIRANAQQVGLGVTPSRLP